MHEAWAIGTLLSGCVLCSISQTQLRTARHVLLVRVFALSRTIKSRTRIVTFAVFGDGIGVPQKEVRGSSSNNNGSSSGIEAPDNPLLIIMMY